jgi:hypothetical protein
MDTHSRHPPVSCDDREPYAGDDVSETGHPASAAVGAYGVRLRGLEDAADLLVPVRHDAPAYGLRSEIGHAESPDEHVDGDHARLRLRSGGEIVIDRLAGRAVFRVPHPIRADELVHPYLAPAAAVMGHWLERQSVHAGAFAVGGRAWGLVGEREAGKSSTLAWLALAGVEVLCDDMLVIDGRIAFAGPRSIDLRADAAARLGAGRPIGMTGARERWRLPLGAVPDECVLAGWVFLTWGDRVDARPLSAVDRLARVVAQRALRVPPARPDALLDLASLPAWELSRPRGWSSLAEAADRLLDLASTTPTAGA